MAQMRQNGQKWSFFQKNDDFFKKNGHFFEKMGSIPSYLTRENGSGHLKKKGT